VPFADEKKSVAGINKTCIEIGSSQSSGTQWHKLQIQQSPSRLKS
jgi:hypothetical protein